MIDTDKYEGHLASEGQTWAWSKWMLKNAETIQQHEATAALLKDAPLLLEEVKRLREAFVIAVRHIGFNNHTSQDNLWHVLKKRGMDDLFDLDEDFGEWEE
jgi:hypothetical protein